MPRQADEAFKETFREATDHILHFAHKVYEVDDELAPFMFVFKGDQAAIVPTTPFFSGPRDEAGMRKDLVAMLQQSLVQVEGVAIVVAVNEAWQATTSTDEPMKESEWVEDRPDREEVLMLNGMCVDRQLIAVYPIVRTEGRRPALGTPKVTDPNSPEGFGTGGRMVLGASDEETH